MSVGRLLIGTGLVLVLAGLVVLFGERLALPFGRMPGDIVWRGKSTTVYFPIVTCLVLSVLGSLVFWLLNRR